jgi:CheY-like chemotaxis protein/anti-sigma regulatory factor (Ser/Thr protein kinase)
VARADQDRLRQAVQNLIDNSIKYSRDSVEVQITTRAGDGFGTIAVADNGIGIARENLSYIFEKFYQVENINTRSHEGVGLGLALTKQYVESMGGTISVESELGAGTTFTIALPLSTEPGHILTESHPVKITAKEPSSSSPEAAPGPPVTCRILAIDDDQFNLQLLQKMLEGRFEVMVASGGKAALEMLEGAKIDLILVDWMMPEMDGLSFVIAVKSNDMFKDIPVAFLSAKAEPEIMEEGLKAGAADFITKPYRRDDLISRINELLAAKVESGVCEECATWTDWTF